MDEVLRMHKLDARDELVSDHQHRLQRKLSRAVVKEVLERRPEQVDNHDIEVTLLSEPVESRYADFRY